MGVSSDCRWNDGPRGKEEWRRRQRELAEEMRRPSTEPSRLEESPPKAASPISRRL